MKISDVMTRDVRTVGPDDAISSAAQMMKQIDAGSLPVAENDRLIGMITDRDIAVRAVAERKGPETRIRDVMTPEVKYCFDDADLAVVAGNMADLKVRRLPVVNREKQLVGMVSLGDFAGQAVALEALSGVTKRGQPHSQ